MREAAEWVERYREFWEDRLDAIAAYLEDDTFTIDGKDEQNERLD